MIDKIKNNNQEQVKKWYFGIQSIFHQIQIKNNWSKEEAWDKLKIELLNKVDREDFVPDDLEWVRDLLLHGKKPSTEEAMRVAQRYPDSTPLIDCLASFF